MIVEGNITRVSIDDAARWLAAIGTALLGLLLISCGSDAPEPELVAAEIDAVPFEDTECSGRFRTVELDHVVEVLDPEQLFDANGAGAAIGDLDDDGWPDIVLGNLHGPVRIFWNQGGASFAPEDISLRRTRAVQLVDHDADGDTDIVLTSGFDPPVVLDNEDATFTEQTLPGVEAPAYSMVWIDPDRDGDLDLVTGAYDMEFGRVIAREFINEDEFGVWQYTQDDDGSFVGSQIAGASHALAMTTVDLDDDGTDELIVGNDFAIPDQVFRWDEGWTLDEDAFSVTTANTMSYDTGDVDGDGFPELYATDMVPFDTSNHEFWSMMRGLEHDPPGPQLVENVLLDLGQDDNPNIAISRGVAASGWSWSGRFADFDHDADLDLYVANGMLPSPLLITLPNSELVEPNFAFENDGTGGFTRAPEWELGVLASTRALAMGDIDRDGDLDILASTVEAPTLLLMNELCTAGSIVIEPVSGGSPVIGARVVAVTGSADSPARQERTIRSGAGYLAADEPIAHFGLGSEATATIEVHWPDGTYSLVDSAEAGTRLTVDRVSAGP